MEPETTTALATSLLVIVGSAQVAVLVAQLALLIGERRQHRLELIEVYRRWWSDCKKKEWGAVVFLGRETEEYYQVADQAAIKVLRAQCSRRESLKPSIPLLDSVREVTSVLSDISVRILQGHLTVSDIYPIFGTELLRHTRPLRKILDSSFVGTKSDAEVELIERAVAELTLKERDLSRSLARLVRDVVGSKYRAGHQRLRKDAQEWLKYHDGIRRRCLILVDLLWAEAARLEDLPAYDLWRAAEAKKRSGGTNRDRLERECFRINGYGGVFIALKLSRFLKHAEYRRFGQRTGITLGRLKERDPKWTGDLIRRTQVGTAAGEAEV